MIKRGAAEGIDSARLEENVGRPFDMEGSRSDILVAGKEDIYLYQQRFNPDLTQQEMPRITKLGSNSKSSTGQPRLLLEGQVCPPVDGRQWR